MQLLVKRSSTVKTKPEKPNVVIYSDHLLPFSQTFVLQQGEALRNYEPHYVGSRRIPGLSLPNDRHFAVNHGDWIGKGMELAHKTLDFSPMLRSYFRKTDPVLIHAHFGPGGAIVLPHARACHLPLMVTFHGFDVTVTDDYARSSFYGHRLFLKRREQLKQVGNQFIAVSHFIERKLLEVGFPEEKIAVHYIGVETSEFEPDLNRERENMVLFVGRLVEKKGCEYLIKAMTEVQQYEPNTELVIIGDGPLRKTLEAMAKERLKKFRFLGAQPATVVKEYMNRAKVFSVPSIVAQSGDAEAFGIVFIEAQTMGLPVVSFATGGIPEAVVHGYTGYLAKEKNWQELAMYIRRLLTDKCNWQLFSDAGRTYVQSRFNLTKQTALLEEYYRQTVTQYAAERRV